MIQEVFCGKNILYFFLHFNTYKNIQTQKKN